VYGRTVKERLLNDLTDDYESAVDPGVIDLKMSVMLLCAYQDEETGFIVSHGWEFYVSIAFAESVSSFTCLSN